MSRQAGSSWMVVLLHYVLFGGFSIVQGQTTNVLSPAVTLRPDQTPATATDPPGPITTTILVLIIAASVLALLIIAVPIFICYQRYTLGRLRNSSRQELSFTGADSRRRESAYHMKLQSELGAANITTFSSLDPESNRRQRKRGMQHSCSEPRLQKSLYGSSSGFMNPSMMGFDRGQGIPSAYSIQSKGYTGFHNNFYARDSRESANEDEYGNDDLGDVGDIVAAITGEQKTKEKETQKPDPLTEASDEDNDDGDAGKEETDGISPRTLVRHYSWHSPGGGFSATMKSGEEVSSPFAHFVSKRMAKHRSTTNSPVSLSTAGPLTEEELEDMLTADPEMTTTDYDTGTDDTYGCSD